MQVTRRLKQKHQPNIPRQTEQPPDDNRQRDADHGRRYSLNVQRNSARVVLVLRIRVQPAVSGRAKSQNRQQ